MARGRGSKRHTHMYHYIDLGYTMAWACALSDCSHYMPPYGKGRIQPNMIGKDSICFTCREPFKLKPELMQDDMPMCFECVNGIKNNKPKLESVLAAKYDDKNIQQPGESDEDFYNRFFGYDIRDSQ